MRAILLRLSVVATFCAGCATDLAADPLATVLADPDAAQQDAGDATADCGNLSREHYELAAAAVAGQDCDEAIVRGTCNTDGRMVCQAGVYVQFPPCAAGWLCTMRQVGPQFQVISQCVTPTQ